MKKNFSKGNALPILLIVVAIILVGGALFYTTNQSTNEVTDVMMKETQQMDSKDAMEEEKMMKETSMGEVIEDKMMNKMDKEMTAEMLTMKYDFTGKLTDVSGGESTGVANSSFVDSTYSLHATFTDLPDPEGTDFYEGWIVRKGANMSVISTGRVDKVDNKYTNLYSSAQDLTDHTFYVLTIEPDDGDPAPAAHILEGTMVKN